MQDPTVPPPSDQAATEGPLTEFIRRFTEFLPDLAAGLFVLAIGIVIGWLVKRLVVRILIWLRLDRLGARRSERETCGPRCTTWSARWR